MDRTYLHPNKIPQRGDIVTCGNELCVVVRINMDRLILRVEGTTNLYETSVKECRLHSKYTPAQGQFCWIFIDNWPGSSMNINDENHRVKKILAKIISHGRRRSKYKMVGHNATITIMAPPPETTHLYGVSVRVNGTTLPQFNVPKPNVFYIDSKDGNVLSRPPTITKVMGIKEVDADYRPETWWNEPVRVGSRVKVHTNAWETTEMKTGTIIELQRPAPHITLYAVQTESPYMVEYKSRYEFTADRSAAPLQNGLQVPNILRF